MQRISWTVSGAAVSCTGSDSETQKNGSEETMAYCLADSLVEVVSFPAPEKFEHKYRLYTKEFGPYILCITVWKKVYH